MKFEAKNKTLVLKPSDNVSEKVAYVQNLYNKADEKINHIDKLRHQLLNYSLVAFSGLLAFIINTENVEMQLLGCVGIFFLMLIFCFRDHTMHKYTHAFESSMYIFAQVMAHLIENSMGNVEFQIYHEDGEKKAVWWKCRQTYIYISLMSFVILAALCKYFKVF